MFLISLVPFSVCETYNDEQTSLDLLRDRPSYIYSRVFDALWHFTCNNNNNLIFILHKIDVNMINVYVLKDFRIRWPVVYFSHSFPTHCIINTLHNFSTLHCQHTPCPLAAVPLRRVTFYIVFMTRVKKAVHMRAFPASGANLSVSPPIEIIRDTKTN